MQLGHATRLGVEETKRVVLEALRVPQISTISKSELAAVSIPRIMVYLPSEKNKTKSGRMNMCNLQESLVEYNKSRGRTKNVLGSPRAKYPFWFPTKFQHLAVSTLFVTTASTETLNGTILGVTCC